MPNQYPPSSFESAVAGFLSSYSQMRGLKMQQRESDIRARAADNADQEAQVRLQEAGYDRLTMPKVEAPPDQGFAQKVGSYLSNHFGSGGDQPSSIVMKTHPSAHDTDVATAEAFQTGRDTARFQNEKDIDTARFQNEKDIEGLKSALQLREERMRQDAEDRRAVARNATDVTVAGIDHQVQAQALAQNQKFAAVDDAINATGGYAQRAWDKIPAATKQQYGLTPMDMNAGVERWRNSKAMLTREGIDAANERSAQRTGSAIWGPPPGIKPPPPVEPTSPATAAGGAFTPEQQSAIAAAAKHIREGTGTLDQAKAVFPPAVYSEIVRQANTPRPALKPVDLAHAKRDPGFKAWLMTRGYSQQELGF